MNAEAELTARIAELEAENAALRAPAAQPKRHGFRAASLASGILIVLGLVLGTLSVVTTHIKTQLTNTDLFVSTFEMLPDEPAVQDTIIGATTNAFHNAVDIPALTKDVFDGIRSLGMPDEAAAALTLLEGPAAHGAESLINSAVTEIITSPAFASVWEQALRVTHSQVVATLSGETDSAVAIGTSGTLEVHLGPIISTVRDKLVAEGVTLAQLIPTTDYSIVLVEDPAIAQLSTVYAAFTIAATWLPWAALVLMTVGVALAADRRRALKATALTAALLMVALGAALSAGRSIVSAQLADPSASLSAEAVAIFYDHATAAAGQRVLAIGAIAVALLIVLWATGASRLAAVMRHGVNAGAAAVHRKIGAPSRTWHSIGTWIDRHHSLVLGVIAVGAAAIVLLSRPLSFSTVIATALCALLVVVIVQFVRLPQDTPVLEDDAAAPEPEDSVLSAEV